LDIAAGMGNLLLTVLLNLSSAGYQAEGMGVDIDDTLLAVAASTSDLTQANVQYFHQDGLQELLIDPVDVAISDLPIGYYPNDQKAKEFLTSTTQGHSYAHHLLLEQAMKYVKPDGFGLFLMPSNFLETEQSEEVKRWFKEEGYLQGMIQLPDELFRNKQSQKSILILQKKGTKAKQAQEVLLVKLDSLKKPEKVTEFFKEFETWKSSSL